MSSAYFGLGALATIDSVIVTWLDGTQEVFTNIYPNQHLNIIEDSVVYAAVYVASGICSGDSLFLEGAFQIDPGTYRDTMTATAGHDSIVITALSITPGTIINIQESICVGDSLYLEGGYQYSAGTYYDTMQVAGCDSIVITDVTVLSTYIGTVDTTICETDTFLGNTYVSDTSLMDLFTGSNGCDSTVITNITVNQFVLAGSTATLCQGDFYNGTAYFTDTTLIDTVQNQFTCDSIISTSIIVLLTSVNSVNVTICKGDLFGGTAYYSDTSLIDSLTKVNGCDSIVNTMLMVDSTYSITIDTTIEAGSLYDGVVHFGDTVLTDSLLSLEGCDSLVQTNLYVVTGFLSGNTHSETIRFSVFPNPVSGSLSMYFDLKRASQITVTIFNMLGIAVAKPISGLYAGGAHIELWNGRTENGMTLPNGIYSISYSVHGARTKNLMLIVSIRE